MNVCLVVLALTLSLSLILLHECVPRCSCWCTFNLFRPHIPLGSPAWTCLNRYPLALQLEPPFPRIFLRAFKVPHLCPVPSLSLLCPHAIFPPSLRHRYPTVSSLTCAFCTPAWSPYLPFIIPHHCAPMHLATTQSLSCPLMCSRGYGYACM